MVEIRPVKASEIQDMLLIDRPIVARAAIVEGNPVAVGGLTWAAGQCWLWFHVQEGSKPCLNVVREAKKMLSRAKSLGDAEVFTVRGAEYPTSERLLKLVGFEFLEIVNDQEVWVWRN